MKKRVLFLTIIFSVILLFGWATISGFSTTNDDQQLDDSIELANQTISDTTEESIVEPPKIDKVIVDPLKESNLNSMVTTEDDDKNSEINTNEKDNTEVQKKPQSEKKSEPKKATDDNKDKEVAPSYTTEKFSGEFMSKVDLNIRTGPSTDFKAVGYLKPYEKAVASEKTTYNGSTWYKITYNGVTGWSSASYLTEYQENAKPKEQSASENNGSTKYKPNHIYFGNKAVPYKNGGQSKGQEIIDGGVYASTWGGAPVYSCTDDLNTHFIGHNPGVFSGMHTHSTFVITDSEGNACTYKKVDLYIVDQYAVDAETGEDHWDRIVGTGGGERITLQSTKKHPLKYIVEAVLVE